MTWKDSTWISSRYTNTFTGEKRYWHLVAVKDYGLFECDAVCVWYHVKRRPLSSSSRPSTPLKMEATGAYQPNYKESHTRKGRNFNERSMVPQTTMLLRAPTQLNVVWLITTNTCIANMIEVKISLSLIKLHFMYGGTGQTASHFPNVGTRKRWVVSFTFWPFYPRRKNTILIRPGVGWPPASAWMLSRREKSLASTWTRIQFPLASSQSAASIIIWK